MNIELDVERMPWDGLDEEKLEEDLRLAQDGSWTSPSLDHCKTISSNQERLVYMIQHPSEEFRYQGFNQLRLMLQVAQKISLKNEIDLVRDSITQAYRVCLHQVII